MKTRSILGASFHGLKDDFLRVFGAGSPFKLLVPLGAILQALLDSSRTSFHWGSSPSIRLLFKMIHAKDYDYVPEPVIHAGANLYR